MSEVRGFIPDEQLRTEACRLVAGKVDAPKPPSKEEQLRAVALATVPPKIIPRDTLLWFGVDFDGTLAESVWTPGSDISNIGPPIIRNLSKLQDVVDAGYKIIIHTSRPWSEYENIEAWLNHYEVPFKEIQCGKPLFHRYVDDRAVRAGDASWLDD